MPGAIQSFQGVESAATFPERGVRDDVALRQKQRNPPKSSTKMEVLQGQTYGFRNFNNYRLRVKVMCS